MLDSFAADYRDPSKKIPADVLAQLKAARFATYGTFYRRQLSFGIMDLTLHTQIHATNADDVLPLSNKILSIVSLPVPEDTAFVAYFGHIIGYGAGYYDATISSLRGRRKIMAIGFCHALQEVPLVPTTPRDQNLDAIVTEREVVIPATRQGIEQAL